MISEIRCSVGASPKTLAATYLLNNSFTDVLTDLLDKPIEIGWQRRPLHVKELCARQ